MMTNGCRTASVTSSPRRMKRPSTLTVGKVGWSVERETWCRLTLERQPSAGAGLALHQSRISMREIRASQTLDLLWDARTDANRTKGGVTISRAPASSGKTAPPAPQRKLVGGGGAIKTSRVGHAQKKTFASPLLGTSEIITYAYVQGSTASRLRTENMVEDEATKPRLKPGFEPKCSRTGHPPPLTQKVKKCNTS